MDVAASSTTSPLKTVNILATSITQQRLATNQAITFTTSPWHSTAKPNMLTLSSSNHVLKNSNHAPLSVLTHCSTKPDTNTNNETGKDKDSAFDSNSSQEPQNPRTPVSSNPLSHALPSLSRGLVFDLGPKNAWDSREIGSPVVKRFLSDEEERWYMWYHGSFGEDPGGDSIGLAVSKNGIHWERGVGPAISSGDVGLVMKCGQDWWAFDTMSIRPSEVVIMSSAKVRASSGVYWLYYTGFNPEKVDFVADDCSSEFNLENPESFGNGKMFFKSLPGLAISQDGRHWARIEGEHHSGALFDVGSEKDWDSLFVAGAQVVFHGNGDLRMYYHSFDKENGEFGIGMARSRDGIRWLKLGMIIGGRRGKIGSFDEFGSVNAHVVRNKKSGNYVMVYEGVGGGGRRSIGLAVSPDGLKDWRRYQDEPILKPSEDGWDCKGVGSPCLVEMDGVDGEWRLYYRGVGNEGKTGIGMAVSQGNDISSFRR